MPEQTRRNAPMAITRNARPFESGAERSELGRLIRRIQTLTREVEELKLRHQRVTELRAKERTLDQLRWRLAAVARRTALEGAF